ncbi:hypothetical protein Pcinc_020796 [Petrolisthes cinctipes]|uniref:Uncharacterized protein n=1 Tax=Petrolisthes cinctipes TaxID=88211 RepID=A0AAE1FIP9_PETCI|nr:hypothetical protein Pcinc_020796 [Petrolisthes cinctipes]
MHSTRSSRPPTLALQEKEKEASGSGEHIAETTSKKLFNLQRQHHQLQDTVKEREAEIECLQQHLNRRGGVADSSSTTATSSRSGSLSARHKSGRKRGSGSSATSGVVSALDPASASESRSSISMEANGRLPPISGDGGRRGAGGREGAGSMEQYRGESPDLHTRWPRHRSISSKDGVEERRTVRVRRRGRSPRGGGDDNAGGGRASLTPSPATTPEPNARRSDPDGDALEDDDDSVHPGHTDHQRSQRLAVSLSQLSQEEEDTEAHRPTIMREFSLIEHYPPRERLTLNGSSGGSDSATSPPPAVRPVPPLAEPRPTSRPLQRDSPPRSTTTTKRHSTVTAADLRTFSSLTKLDSSLPPKPTRSAITP